LHGAEERVEFRLPVASKNGVAADVTLAGRAAVAVCVASSSARSVASATALSISRWRTASASLCAKSSLLVTRRPFIAFGASVTPAAVAGAATGIAALSPTKANVVFVEIIGSVVANGTRTVRNRPSTVNGRTASANSVRSFCSPYSSAPGAPD
jgi:hypothetical protein